MNQSEYDELALKIAHDVISRGTTFYPEEIIEFANRLRVEWLRIESAKGSANYGYFHGNDMIEDIADCLVEDHIILMMENKALEDQFVDKEAMIFDLIAERDVLHEALRIARIDATYCSLITTKYSVLYPVLCRMIDGISKVLFHVKQTKRPLDSL